MPQSIRTIALVLLVWLGLLFVPFVCHAQQGNVWCFGYHAGIDFNYSPPKAIATSMHGLRHTTDVSIYAASISDCKGQLLFYGNAGEVFNRNHKLMPHGLISMLYDDDVHILPVPGDSFKYFYLHSSGLMYTIIDMKLDSGRGDVDTTHVNILSPYASYISGAIYEFSVIKNSTGTGYWIVSFPKKDSICIFSFSANGFGKPKKQPKITSSVPVSLKFNHKGDRIFIQTFFPGNNYGAIQYTFDNALGVLSNPVIFFDCTPTTNNYGSNMYISQAEYSENDSMLYLAVTEANSSIKNFESRIYQCEAYTSPAATLTKVFTREYVQNGSIQTGPDNRIYFGYALDSWVHVINYPDKKGALCDVVENYINLTPGYMGGHFPRVYAPYQKIRWKASSSCSDSTHFKNLSDTSFYKGFTWYFGDGDSATAFAPVHAYIHPGKYRVLLKGWNICGAVSYFADTVVVTHPAHAGFFMDSIQYNCASTSIYIHNISGDSTQHFLLNYGDSSPAVCQNIFQGHAVWKYEFHV